MIYGEMQLPRVVLDLDGELKKQKAGGFEHEVKAAALSLSRSPWYNITDNFKEFQAVLSAQITFESG